MRARSVNATVDGREIGIARVLPRGTIRRVSVGEAITLLARRAWACAQLLESDRAAVARSRLGRWRPRLEAALRERPSRRVRFGLVVGLDACLEQSSDRDEHLELLDDSARTLDGSPHGAYLQYRAARVEFLRGHWESALERVQTIPCDGLPSGDLETDVKLIESASLRYLGPPERALAVADTALVRATTAVGRMRAHFHRAAALQVLGRLDEVEAASRSTLALTLSLGAARHRALVLTHLSLHAFASGRSDLACEYAAEGARRFAALGDRMMTGKALGFLARYQLERGDAAARRTLARAHRSTFATGDRGTITNLTLLQAEHLFPGARVRLQECLWDNETLGLGVLATRVRDAIDRCEASREAHLALGRWTARLVDGRTVRTIDLTRHEKPRRVLRRLAEARLVDQGPLGVEALLVAAWPGERLVATSGQNRVYAAIRCLRRLGLQDVLRSSSAGYELTCPVRLEA